MMITEVTEVEAALTADEWLQLNKLAHRAAAETEADPKWYVYMACATIAHEHYLTVSPNVR